MQHYGKSGPETVLKKYPNRRIYDPSKNAHVTLSEIADRVKSGERIRILDHHSGEDLTQVIMGQVLFETMKTRPDYLPLDLILLMIRAQDNLVRDFLQHGLPQAYHVYLDAQRRMMSGMNWSNTGFPMPSMPVMPGFGVFGPGYGTPTQGAPSSMPAGGAGNPAQPGQAQGVPPAGGQAAPVSGVTSGDTVRLQEEMDSLRREVERLKRREKPAKEKKAKPRKGRGPAEGSAKD